MGVRRRLAVEWASGRVRGVTLIVSATAAVTSGREGGVRLGRRLERERVDADGDGGVGREGGGRAESEGRRRAEEGQLDEGFEGEQEEVVAEGQVEEGPWAVGARRGEGGCA